MHVEFHQPMLQTPDLLIISNIPSPDATGLFKMFSHWVLGIFNVQIQSERQQKLM